MTPTAPTLTQSGLHKLAAGIFFALLSIVVSSGLAFAQASEQPLSLGEIARQNRARRPEPARHVFTNEDLARPRILDGIENGTERKDSPEAAPVRIPQPAAPGARPLNAQAIPQGEPAEAGAKLSGSAPAPAAAIVPLAKPWPKEMPLGDVARVYRKLKESPALDPESAVHEVMEARQVAPAASSKSAQQPLPRADQILAATPRRMVPAPPAGPQRTPAAKTPQPAQAAKPRERKVIAVATEAPAQVRAQSGDSLWKLAARYLGRGAAWKRLAAANPALSNPNRIFPGQMITIPAAEQMPTVSSITRVLVQPGDSLWKLARDEWGSGSAWSCIARANPELRDAARIFPGQMLLLPATCPRT